jgi:hypothetical protein
VKTARDKEHEARMEHARTCTGLVLTGYMTTVEGQQVRVLDGRYCACPKGASMEKAGGLDKAIEQAARRRGPAWVTRTELEAKHFQAAGLPMWGAGVVSVGP